ncbi:flagellar basal body rod protein FlgG [Bacillus sp. FJAT-29790]|uniref:flagellar basal body rod protein FlgG n=1 Tax=Bacillus sp. FJAT-29790 TaxID=1895002 RepID=UPI001C23D392|nr:flagellar basal body rod protein FlgG [Bacillus sp. FJAT-29790]MBU8877837.1 flagellar basal body rod protein FlgG [Bacillus sp. FJAT-29790]
MLRSMYSGIGGMKNFQTKLDVIGNNIANVNTYGFKKGRVTFKEMVSQTISGASGPGDNSGGVNPKQVGLGSQLSSIDTIDTQGSLQTTGRVLDIGIQGDGYLMVDRGGTTYYTRSGNLYLDEDAQLVTSSGDLVLTKGGLTIKLNGGDANQIKSLSISNDGMINFLVDGSDIVNQEGPIGIARFNNNGGLDRVGDNLFKDTVNSGTPLPLSPGEDGAGTLISGTLEMSNVDLSEEFTEMIVAQRGFQANTRIITTSDEILQELVNLKR